MKFTAKLDFKHGHAQFEAGNTYDSAKQGLADAQVEEFYRVGWCDIEGKDPGPDATPGAQRITVHDAVHATGE